MHIGTEAPTDSSLIDCIPFLVASMEKAVRVSVSHGVAQVEGEGFATLFGKQDLNNVTVRVEITSVFCSVHCVSAHVFVVVGHQY